MSMSYQPCCLITSLNLEGDYGDSYVAKGSYLVLETVKIHQLMGLWERRRDTCLLSISRHWKVSRRGPQPKPQKTLEVLNTPNRRSELNF